MLTHSISDEVPTHISHFRYFVEFIEPGQWGKCHNIPQGVRGRPNNGKSDLLTIPCSSMRSKVKVAGSQSAKTLKAIEWPA